MCFLSALRADDSLSQGFIDMEEKAVMTVRCMSEVSSRMGDAGILCVAVQSHGALGVVSAVGALGLGLQR